MATRSTITVKTHFATVHLYRHWDGYPECTGRHLAWAIRDTASLTAEELVAKLVQTKEREPHGAGQYQFTDDARRHTDREWHYEIKLNTREEPWVVVHHRPIGEAMRVVFDGRLWLYRRWITERFVQFLARVRQRRAA